MLELMSIDNPWGKPCWRVRQTTSTMDETRALERSAHGGAAELSGALVMADHQSRGRGRFADRRWRDGEGRDLLFTLMLRPAGDFPPSLVVAHGVAGFLREKGLDPRVKWPNDLLVGGAKICGILVEASPRLLHCGVGLNVGPVAADPDDRLPATSLSAAGVPASPAGALAELLPHLWRSFRLPAAAVKAEIEACLANRGRRVELRVGAFGAERKSGVVAGLADDGALLLETEAGVEAIRSGE